jgi:kynurenine formamidase
LKKLVGEEGKRDYCSPPCGRNRTNLQREESINLAFIRPVTSAAAVALLLGASAGGAFAQSTSGASDAAHNNPVDEEWWPSEFGPEDQAGATNWITPEKRLQAVQLVKQGKVATLGMPYHNRVPLFPGRVLTVTIPGGGEPTHDLPWSGDHYRQTFMDEMVTAQIGQVGTQFDALSHPMIKVEGAEGWEDGNCFYNKHRLEDIGGPFGLGKLGPKHVGSFFTRGILIDVPALKGSDRLEKGYVVTMDDFRQALERQGIDDVQQGDEVLVRTGWNDLWRENLDKSPDEVQRDNNEFNAGEPGVAPEVCDHLAERKAAMLGMDNWGIEPYDFSETPPSEIEEWGYCHANLVSRRDIYLMENMDLKPLSDDQAYEFLFAWAPLKIVGATGSPGNPIAAY